MSLKPEQMTFLFRSNGQQVIDELVINQTDVNVAAFIEAILDKFDYNTWTDADAALSSYLLKKQVNIEHRKYNNEPS